MRWRAYHAYAVSIYAFNASGAMHLSFASGEALKIVERSGDWMRGYLLRLPHGSETDEVPSIVLGIFPAKFVRICSEPLCLVDADADVDEKGSPSSRLYHIVDATLLEWAARLRDLHSSRDFLASSKASTYLSELASLKRDLGAADSSEEEKQQLFPEVFELLEQGNTALSLYVHHHLPSGDIASHMNTPVVRLLRLYEGGDTRKKVSASTQPQSTSQLLLRFDRMSCKSAEPLELCFALYSITENAYMTEDFKVLETLQAKVPTGSAAKFYDDDDDDEEDNQHSNEVAPVKTLLIKDLEDADLSSMWLMCRIYRIGRLDPEKKFAAGAPPVRRPFACGGIKLEAAMLKDGHEFQVKALPLVRTHLLDHGMAMMEAMVRDGTALWEEGEAMSLSLTRYQHVPLAAEETPQCSVRKMCFPEEMKPGDERNDMYITMERLELSGKKNAEVVLSLRNSDSDEVITEGIYSHCGVGAGGIHTPVSFHIFTTGAMSKELALHETVRISLPKDLVEKATLHVEVSHVTQLGKRERYSEGRFPLASSAGLIPPNGKHKIPLKRAGEELEMRLTLVSTKLTQNALLNVLLRWEKEPAASAQNALKRFTFIDQLEIVNFLQEVFDALFGILSNTNDEATKDIVYSDIVYIIGFLVDARITKFRHFRNILDNYVEERFHFPTVWRSVLKSLAAILASYDDVKKNSQVRASIKAMHYMVKFIVKSRLQAKKEHMVLDDQQFEKQMLQMLSAINDLMQKRSPDWVIGAQTLALKHFSSIFEDLSLVFKNSDMGNIATDFLESLDLDDGKVALVVEKLVLIQKIARGSILLEDTSREMVLPSILREVQRHIVASSQERYHSALIATELFGTLRRLDDEELLWQLCEMIPTMLQSQKSERATSPASMALMTCLFAMMHCMSETMWDRVVEESADGLRILEDLLVYLEETLREGAYPLAWQSLHFFHLSAAAKCLVALLAVLKRRWLQEETLDQDAWMYWVRASLAFLTFAPLQLQDFSRVQRQRIVGEFGDLRSVVALVLVEGWILIPSEWTRILADFIPQIMLLWRSDCDRTQHVGVLLWLSLCLREWQVAHALTTSEKTSYAVITKLVNDGKMNRHFMECLGSQVAGELAQFQANDPSLTEAVNATLKVLMEHLQLLLTLEQYNNVELYQDERAETLLHLMKTSKEQQYEVYARELMEMHLSVGNQVEAACAALQLLHKMLEKRPWLQIKNVDDHQVMTAYKAIDYLVKSKQWESAIQVIRALRQWFEDSMQDYGKVADLLLQECELFRSIVGKERFYATYYRVGFFGLGFSSQLRGKEYVYRAKELQRVSEFSNSILKKYPKAERVTGSDYPSDDVLVSKGQFIQITTVNPCLLAEYESGHEPIRDSSVPKHIQNYELHHKLRTFKYTKAFFKEKTGNEFRDVWTKTVCLKVKGSFPCAQRRLKISDRVSFERSPIENALLSLSTKNRELLDLTDIYSRAKAACSNVEALDPPLHSFTMVLNGVIDAAVNGGVFRYCDAFLGEDMISTSSPETRASLREIQQLLKDQAKIVEKALVLHRSLITAEVQGLQDKMDLFYTRLVEELTEKVYNVHIRI
jgi:hypothetical protein